MSLKAVLTVGWRDEVAAAGSASLLFAESRDRGGESGAPLAAVLARRRPRLVVGLDRLFRLRSRGFGPVQSMTAALSDYAAAESEDVFCHVDAFSYAFLSAAKNFDLLLAEETHPPADAEPASPFRRALPGWTEHIAELHEFERVGRPIADDRRADYLALRRVVGRPTARDERTALVALLVSGPSTVEDVSLDLGLSYSLGDRVFATLADAGAVDGDGDGDGDGDVFAVRERALPTVLFCLRATMGMDYLDILGSGGR